MAVWGFRNGGELRLNLVTPLKTKMDSKNDGFYWDEHAAIDARNPARFTTELLHNNRSGTWDFNISYLSNTTIFPFHDNGRKSRSKK